MLTDIAWICGALFALLVVSLFAGMIYGGWRDRKEQKTAEEEGTGGADMAWAEKVHAISVDEKLDPTGEIDMTELHTRLALEDVEIKANKQAKAVVDEAVSTLLDDELWSKYLIKCKTKEIQNV